MDDMTQTLLVEGNDDRFLIYALCEKFNVKETFKVEDCQGLDNIIIGFPIRLKGDGEIKTIGIVVDADVNIQSRWRQIRDVLVNSNLYADIPEECPSDGLILLPINPDDIKVGVWIMPNNRSNGMLEDFATFLIPKDDSLLPEVDKVLTDIETRKLNRYNPTHHSKARIHTWLAWQKDPGTPLGWAVTKKYLSATPSICQDFVNWLNALYN